jgi:GT2 family glycosyltransferase
MMRESGQRGLPSVSVIIPAFTDERWDLLVRAVESVTTQTYPPIETVVCIDNNVDLFETAERYWTQKLSPSSAVVRVVLNEDPHETKDLHAHRRAHGARRRFGAGRTRNKGAQIAEGEILAFIDDDAAAEPDWLAELVTPYVDDSVLAVGGPPLPNYETSRPPWMPRQFDWVFGCAYDGLPIELGPVRHLIGANMSVRATAFHDIGGFHSIDFDDMDMCHRVAALGGRSSVLYQPDAVVNHYVPAERLEWRYFCRRCFFVNKHKVDAFAEMGDAANLEAEMAFVVVALRRGLMEDLKKYLAGDPYGVQRAGALMLGISLAGLGHVAGRVSLLVSNLRRESRSMGTSSLLRTVRLNRQRSSS